MSSSSDASMTMITQRHLKWVAISNQLKQNEHRLLLSNNGSAIAFRSYFCQYNGVRLNGNVSVRYISKGLSCPPQRIFNSKL